MPISMRGFVAKWMPVEFKPLPRFGKEGILIRARPPLLAIKSGRALWQQRNAHPNWYNSAIMRSFRARVEAGKIIIPYAKTTFFKTVGTRRAGEFPEYVKRYAAKAKGKEFARLPFNIGVNAIVELVDKTGRPAHIVMIKRGQNVFEAPGYWDFPAGIVRFRENPVERIKNRIEGELGVKGSQIDFIGKNLEPAPEKNPPALAVHLEKRLANYNIV